jgi:hypothetical protein
MSQRRGALPKETANPELVPFSEVLDKPAGGMQMDRDSMVPLETSKTPMAPKSAPPVSLDARYEKETQSMKLKKWQEGPFAAGFTESTWDEEYAKYKNNPKDACFSMAEHDGMPCICCSAVVCSALGATRVGNMAVLKQSTEWVEEQEEDENGEMKVRRFTRPRLDVVVGPVRKLVCVKNCFPFFPFF